VILLKSEKSLYDEKTEKNLAVFIQLKAARIAVFSDNSAICQ